MNNIMTNGCGNIMANGYGNYLYTLPPTIDYSKHSEALMNQALAQLGVFTVPTYDDRNEQNLVLLLDGACGEEI